MTAIFRGAEDIHFSPIGGTSVSTAAGYFRSGYARCALSSNTDGRWRIPASYGLSFGDFWLTARFRRNFAGSVLDLIYLLDSSDNIILNVQCNGSNIPSIIVGGTTIATGSSPLAINSLTKLDFHINYASVGGFFYLYGDGDLLFQYNGDITTSGLTYASGIDFVCNKGGYGQFWSEVIADTSDTRSMSLCTIAPNGAGSTDQWSGSYTDVNEITENQSTINSTATAAQEQLYTGNSLPSGNFAIVDTTWTARAATQTGSPQHLDPLFLTESTTYDDTTNAKAPISSLQTYFQTYPTNPVTGVAWTPAEIDALQAGFKSAT